MVSFSLFRSSRSRRRLSDSAKVSDRRRQFASRNWAGRPEGKAAGFVPPQTTQSPTKSIPKATKPAAVARRRLAPVQSVGRAPKTRLAFVWAILLVGMVALILNLLRIQVFQASMLQKQAKAQHVMSFNPVTPRRSIADRNGDVMAIDRPVYTLYAHPYMFEEPKTTVAAALAPLLNVPLDKLIQQFNSADSGIQVQETIPEDLARRIEALSKGGLDLEPHQQRLYPQQDLSANIVGYVNLDRQGQAGIEAYYEKQLQQPVGGLELSRSGDGSIIPVGLPADFLESQKTNLQLQLTLDNRLQRATRYALKQMMHKYSAKRGTVIVMNVNDGSIASLVSEPSYDLNKFYDANLEQLKDWVISDLYEPGSTFKPVNVAIALEAGAVQPNTMVYDDGAIEIEGWTIQNSDFESSGGRGEISLSEVLQYSSNVGMVRVMQHLDPGIYHGWLERMGLSKPTGIDLPAEASGQMKEYKEFVQTSIEAATTAFGQGFSLTPMKLIQLHSMVANGGKLVTPHLVQGLADAKGHFSWKPNIPEPKLLIAPQHSKTVLDMMEQVVTEGTGKAAQIAGYRIAGKTGTAQKASPTGGYIDGARITSFVGILPAEAPRYAILAVVDEPQGDDAYGGTVAAPIVKSVMQTLITTEHIKPSQPQALLAAPAPDSAADLFPVNSPPIDSPIETYSESVNEPDAADDASSDTDAQEAW